jgi:ABC-type phosphate transport system permease subunit
MKKTIQKYLLLIYAIVSSVLFGGFVGFLIIYPFFQILFDKLDSYFGYDEPAWVNYLIYAAVILSIAICSYINRKRYFRHLKRKGLN